MLHRSLRLLILPLLALVPSPTRADEASRTPESIPEAKHAFHLFLLVGQSNMAGRGELAPPDQEPHPRVWMLNKENQWVPATDPLHFDKPGLVGVGLGKTVASDYADAHPEVHVGLIPCAVGGSPIAAWEPGGYHSQTGSHPYDDAIARARHALQKGTLKGMLWHQGESDATPELAKVYESKLHALIKRLRTELSAPQVPFIAGQMLPYRVCSFRRTRS